MGIYLNFRNNIYDDNDLITIANSIKSGEICILPTDTVYGVACDGLNKKAVEQVYTIKNRQLTNPINLLVCNIDMIKNITQNISELEYLLISKFMPGPFTLILPKTNIVPNIVTANSPYVGIRIPNNEIILKIIEYSNTPLATTSANVSGKLSATEISDIINDFDNQVSYIVDSGPSSLGIESTVVKVENGIPIILRQGYILKEDILNVSKDVTINTSLSPSFNLAKSKKENNLVLIYSIDNKKMIDLIYQKHINTNNSLIICSEENANIYINLYNIDSTQILSYGKKDNYVEISKKLFHLLNSAIAKNYTTILIEGIKKEHLGITLMDKLISLVNKNNYIQI